MYVRVSHTFQATFKFLTKRESLPFMNRNVPVVSGTFFVYVWAEGNIRHIIEGGDIVAEENYFGILFYCF